MDTCRASNQYSAFLLRLVEGEIIEKLTGDELLCISQDLLKEGKQEDACRHTHNTQKYIPFPG